MVCEFKFHKISMLVFLHHFFDNIISAVYLIMNGEIFRASPCRDNNDNNREAVTK